MKLNKGRIIILVAMLLTALLWWVSTPMENISVMDQLSHTIAGLSLTGLVLVFVMSVRSKTLDSWFGVLFIVSWLFPIFSVYTIPMYLVNMIYLP